LSRSLALEQGKLIGSTVSAVRSIESLKSSGLEDDAFGQWAGIQAKSLNAEQALGASSVFLDMLPTLLSGLTVAAILGIGGLRVIEGSLTLGGLVAFQSLMASFSEPITALVNQVGSFQVIKGGLERLEDVYARRERRAEQYRVRLLDPRAAVAHRSFDLDQAGDTRRPGRSIRKREIDARPSPVRALQALVR
jgi:ABC-type bacteriocin/lantibiotic exporter with double-glycine peptidase domain